MTKAFLISLLLTPLWAQTFKSEQVHPVPKELQESAAENQAKVDIVILKGKWTPEKVYKRFKKLRKIYEQCRVGVVISSLKEVEWKYSGLGLYYDLDDDYTERYHDGTLQLLTDLNIQSRPLAIFLDSFDEYMPKMATAFPLLKMVKQTPALNTLWITDKVNDKDYLKLEPDSYSVFAHELGHLLLNDTHLYGPDANLMHHQLSMLNDQLSEKQCERIRKNLNP